MDDLSVFTLTGALMLIGIIGIVNLIIPNLDYNIYPPKRVYSSITEEKSNIDSFYGNEENNGAIITEENKPNTVLNGAGF